MHQFTGPSQRRRSPPPILDGETEAEGGEPTVVQCAELHGKHPGPGTARRWGGAGDSPLTGARPSETLDPGRALIPLASPRSQGAAFTRLRGSLRVSPSSASSARQPPASRPAPHGPFVPHGPLRPQVRWAPSQPHGHRCSRGGGESSAAQAKQDSAVHTRMHTYIPVYGHACTCTSVHAGTRYKHTHIHMCPHM